MKRHGRQRAKVGLTAAAVVMLASAQVLGHGMIPHHTPVDRLVTNIEAKLAQKPDDAELHYTLGRLHALAFERKAATVAVFDRQGEIEVGDRCWQNIGQDEQQQPLPEAALKTHLTEAIEHLGKAIELDKSKAHYHLALGSVLEAGLPMAAAVTTHPLCAVKGTDGQMPSWYQQLISELGSSDEATERVIEVLRYQNWEGNAPSARDWIISKIFAMRDSADKKVQAAVKKVLLTDWNDQITDQFFAGFSLAIPEDGKADTKPIWRSMECWVAYESATGYVRVVEKRGVRANEKVRLATAKAALKAFNDLPNPNAITPIVFGVGRTTSLEGLTYRNVTASFDLDGSGRAQEWTWVKPDAALLVWDPENTGKITSGWQLFGSVSWRLFFENGYDALSLLDDNHDGELCGGELKGLAAWFDRNSNGISDVGEVTPLEQLGIAALACTATTTEDGCPANLDGLRLTDGRVLPTYDWIATQIEAGRSSVHVTTWPLIACGVASAALFAPVRRRRAATKGAR